MEDRRIARIVFGRHFLFGGFPASEMIALLKELPENTNIIGFGEEISRAAVCIGVEHPSFKKVGITECMPEIEASFVKTEEGTKVTVNLSSVLEKPDYTGPVKFEGINKVYTSHDMTSYVKWESNWKEIAEECGLTKSLKDMLFEESDLKPRKGYEIPLTATQAVDHLKTIGNSVLVKYANGTVSTSTYDDIQNRIYGSFTFPSDHEVVKYVNEAVEQSVKNLTTMSSYDDDNEYPLWVTEENIKAQQEALDNLHKQLAGTPTIPANQIYDPGELSRALDEGYNWAIKNHPDNFKAEHEHKWQRYNGAFRSFDFCEVDGCKMNKDDDGRIWKS